MKFDNQMTLVVDAKTKNEAFVRSTIAAFCVQVNPKLSEINDIKTSVSEAITNSIVHGYEGKENGKITICVGISKREVWISVLDDGVGVLDIEKARQPFFTTKPEQERSGMGFTVMESFMDKVIVKKNGEKGLAVHMRKRFGD